MTSTTTDRRLGLNSGMAVKVPVKAATTANLTLSGEQTVDGVALVTGNRVLVKNQTTTADNGIYVVDTGTWTRDKDFDGAFDIVKGTLVLVTDGSTNTGYFKVSTSDPITIGTSGLSFTRALESDSDNIDFTQAGAGAFVRSLQGKVREIEVNVGDFGNGLVNDGVTDNSATWALAVAAANLQASAAVSNGYPISTARLTWPSGDYYVATGASVATCNIEIEGKGAANTRIRIGSGQALLTITAGIYRLALSELMTEAGKNIVAHTYTGTSVAGSIDIHDCVFFDYTECAIGSLAADRPYWKIKHNVFYGTTSSFGVVLPALPDGSTIEDNAFLLNRVHVKVVNDGPNAVIKNNDFIRFSTGGGTALIDVWLVPGQQTVGLVGTQITDNKFGNENLSTIDYRILIADEDTGTGTNHFSYPPKLTASAGWASAIKITGNRVGGVASARAFIVSWTVQLTGLEVKNHFYGSIIPTLTFGAGVNVPSGTQNALINTFEASNISDPTSTLLSEPVVPYAGNFDDPNALYQGYSTVFSYRDSGFDPSFLDLTTQDIAAFAIGDGAGASVADALGGNAAVEFTATASTFQAFGTFTAATAARVAFVEFDLKRSSSLPITTLDFRISNNANLNDIAVRRLIFIPTHWKRIRIPFSLPSLSATYNLASFQIQGYSGGVATKFKVARMRVYHAHEAINTVTLNGTLNTNAPVTETGATRTVLATDAAIICNRAGTITLTLPSAGLYYGREITVRTIQAQTVVSNASDVVPLVGGAAGTAILAATAGKWALLKSDGTSWQIMAGN